MDKFVGRPVEYYKVPIPNGVKILHPEKVILDFGSSISTDLGSLCYLRRSGESRTKGKGRRVDLSSFNKARAKNIQEVIKQIGSQVAQSGLSPKTLFNKANLFVRFMDWCDSNQHSHALKSETDARSAFRNYVGHLRQLVDQNKMGTNLAARFQNYAKAILEDYLDIADIGRGLNLLIKDRNLIQPTSVPDDAAQEEVLAWCTCLFEGFSELIVDQKPYPFALPVPGYLGWPNNCLWVFPTKTWCYASSATINDRCCAYDYANGRVRTVEEILKLYGERYKYIKRTYTVSVKRAHKTIERANKDLHCWQRVHRGMLAIRTFFFIFLANTGMNPTPVRNLRWNEELEESVCNPLTERQGFRTIKYRAGGRLVSFEVGVQIMPLMRRYLQLRNYLLNGRHCDYLFFEFGHYRSGREKAPKVLSWNSVQTMYGTLKDMGLLSSKVNPREMRAAKQDYVIRNAGPVAAAIIMQHTPETAQKHYTNGSEVSQQLELSAFFNQVESAVLTEGRKVASIEVNAAGLCISPQHPQAIKGDLPFTPDCKKPEGCLFCDKYRAHADETDTRKLLSARYCIRKSSHLASSPEQYDRLFGPVLQRISFILNEIKRQDEQMVKKLEREVDIEGELNGFWAAKLETLMELELV